jgi:hypothetical protein
MANPEHLEILRQGVKTWNRWRRDHRGISPDLSDISFREEKYRNIDFISLPYDPNYTDSGRRILSEAMAKQESLRGFLRSLLADFRKINLRGADLRGADLNGTFLDGADLTESDLRGADFTEATLERADFSKARLGRTNFGINDLSSVIGLDTVEHSEPSFIGIDTIYQSGGKIPEAFLLGCGVTEQFIAFIPSLIGAVEPFQYHSCFISYSTKDEEFAKRLHSRLRDAKVRVWFAPEDIKGGVKLYDQIERAIQLHDRLLLVLSDNSLQSEWVMTEIRKAREAEKRENRRKLFPIRLADFDQIRKWRCPDADGGKDLAVEVREYFIPDFSNWKDHDSFEKAFERLLRDLREAEDVKGAEVNGAQSNPQKKKVIEDGEIIVGEITHANKPYSLDELRSRLTDEQRNILNTISHHLLDGRERKWIRSGFLQHRLGEGYDENKIHSIIMPLGGSVVYESTFVGNGTRYVLTMLGLLLTERGEEIEIVFAKYLEYVRERFIETSGAGERVVLSDMAEKQGLTSDQFNLLGRVLDLSDFFGGDGLPLCVDKLVGVADLRAYVREHEFGKFDPRVPIIGGPFGYRGDEMPSKKNLQLGKDVRGLAPVVYISRPSINVQGDYMGDTYNVSGQAGAVGQNAHAHNMTFNQIVNHFEKSIDLPALAKQLTELREEMANRQDSSPQAVIAQGEAAKAEMAAKEGNTSKVVEHLKTGGQWLLDIAKETGKEILTAAIKTSMGVE